MILEDKIYDELPEHLRSGIYLYIEKKVKPGSFLCAVISNDLFDAVGHFSGDLYELKKIIFWFVWKAPSQSWGSKDKMDQWLIKDI